MAKALRNPLCFYDLSDQRITFHTALAPFKLPGIVKDNRVALLVERLDRLAKVYFLLDTFKSLSD